MCLFSVPGVEGATAVGEGAMAAAGVTGVVGVWAELSLGAPPTDGVKAADWLRELEEKERMNAYIMHVDNVSRRN